MKIISKSKAEKLIVNSLFNPVNGHTLNKGKFDNGHYKWTGKAKDYANREVTDVNGVHAVYVECRKDSEGNYAQLMCVYE